MQTVGNSHRRFVVLVLKIPSWVSEQFYVYGNLVRWLGHLRTVSAEVFTDCLHTRITVGRRAPAALGCPLPSIGWIPKNFIIIQTSTSGPRIPVQPMTWTLPQTLQLEAKLKMGKKRRLFLYIGDTLVRQRSADVLKLCGVQDMMELDS